MIFNRRLMSGNLGTTLIISGVVLTIGVTFLMVFLPMLTRPETNLWLGDGIFRISIAETQLARERGLSGKSELADDQALLMVFPSEDKWGIWMKNMNFPLDIVWLGSNKKVIYIVKNATYDDQTTVYKPKSPAKYVVEVPAGTVTTKSIGIGAQAIFQLDGEDK